MKRPWKVREIATGRVIRSYATDEAAFAKYLWMFETETPVLARRAGELELVGPDGVYPVDRVMSSMKTIQRSASFMTSERFRRDVGLLKTFQHAFHRIALR